MWFDDLDRVAEVSAGLEVRSPLLVAGPPGFEPGTSATGPGPSLRVKSPPLYLAELRAHLGSVTYTPDWVNKYFSG